MWPWLHLLFTLESNKCRIPKLIQLGLISRVTISDNCRASSTELLILTRLPRRMQFGMPKGILICSLLGISLIRHWTRSWSLTCLTITLLRSFLLIVGWSTCTIQQQALQAILGDATIALSLITTRFLTRFLWSAFPILHLVIHLFFSHSQLLLQLIHSLLQIILWTHSIVEISAYRELSLTMDHKQQTEYGTLQFLGTLIWVS